MPRRSAGVHGGRQPGSGNGRTVLGRLRDRFSREVPEGHVLVNGAGGLRPGQPQRLQEWHAYSQFVNRYEGPGQG
jgi:hypothetical protein